MDGMSTSKGIDEGIAACHGCNYMAVGTVWTKPMAPPLIGKRTALAGAYSY